MAKIARFKGRGDDLIDDHRRLRISQSVFQTVTDLNAQLAVITRHDQQGAVVLIFLPDTPGAAQLITKVFNGGALQVRHGDDNHLLTRGFFVGGKGLA